MVKIDENEKQKHLNAIREITGEDNTTHLEQEKILVLGLDNSGKTSIVLALKGNENLLSYYSLKPTKGIQINKTVQ